MATAPGNDQHRHGRPERSCRSGDCGHQERSGDRTDLIKCLVHAETASESRPQLAACASRAVLAGLRTAFPSRSPKMRTQARASPAPARNGVIAKAGTQTQSDRSRRT